MPEPARSRISGSTQYRIVPSRFPPIDAFEDLVADELKGALLEVEAMTNDRLREQIGELSLVLPQDRVFGPGASVIMAAFTHIGRPSRFTDGAYGVYYAALDLESAVAETVHHRTRFLARTAEPPCEIDMRVYKGEIARPLLDIRPSVYAPLHRPDDYGPSRTWAAEQRQTGAWGLHYRSVRCDGGECIAALRPPAVSIPRQHQHLAYVWDGVEIVHVYRKSTLRGVPR